MLKILTKPPLSHLVPNSSKPNISLSLYAIVSLHLLSFLVDINKVGQHLFIDFLGVVTYILIIVAAFYSLSSYSHMNKAKLTADVELEKLCKLKLNIAIFYQMIITLVIFFSLVIKAVVN